MDRALCLNCGLRIPHQRDARIVMGFRPGIADSPDYVVAVDGIEVHRCRGPSKPPTRRTRRAPQ